MMEVVHILPTAVAIIPCPFHNDIKDTMLSEVKEQEKNMIEFNDKNNNLKHIQHYSVCLLYTSPSPRDKTVSRMPSSA